ncbi:MAG: HalX domain-containing protein [Halobacteria archaeon]|nr:HalX domain-containing protein [Halobacteria archaeon]
MTQDHTVLIVEDEVDTLDIYEAWLEDEYDVRTAKRGQEGLDKLDNDVDVVLLDRRMPGLSGDDVLERIKQEGYRCRIAMVTAVEPDFDIIDMPFDDYALKPVSRDDMMSMVEHLIMRAQYDQQIQEYFSLASKIAVLEREKTHRELQESDEFNRLKEEFDEMGDRIDRTLDQIDDFVMAFYDISRVTH